MNESVRRYLRHYNIVDLLLDLFIAVVVIYTYGFTLTSLVIVVFMLVALNVIGLFIQERRYRQVTKILDEEGWTKNNG